MVVAQPHYLLFCDTHVEGSSDGTGNSRSRTEQHHTSTRSVSSGRWHFVLEQLDGSVRFEATDAEREANRERLALMSVVRGLEALEQPSKVTLVTTSRYVSRGLRYGLNTWRESDYRWERFGVQMPIRNADLWQRVDGALKFHGVTCRLIQSGLPQRSLPAATPQAGMETSPAVEQTNIPLLASPIDSILKTKHPSDSIGFREVWWQLAAAWIKWWRGRAQHRPAFYGT